MSEIMPPCEQDLGRKAITRSKTTRMRISTEMKASQFGEFESWRITCALGVYSSLHRPISMILS